MTFAFESDHPIDLHETVLPGVNLEGLGLSAGNIFRVRWRHTILRRATLINAKADGAVFRGTEAAPDQLALAIISRMTKLSDGIINDAVAVAKAALHQIAE